MTNPTSDVLSREVKYSGERISVKSLEDTIGEARQSQNTNVGELKVLREQNVELQETLSTEIRKLRKLSDYLAAGPGRRGPRLAHHLGRLPHLLHHHPPVPRGAPAPDLTSRPPPGRVGAWRRDDEPDR